METQGLVSTEEGKYRLGQTNALGRVVCGAPCADGGPCQVVIIDPDGGRCMAHGGFPEVKRGKRGATGRYAKLPTRLREMFDQRINDPQLLELDAEIAFYHTRIEELVSMLEDTPPAKLWTRVMRLAQKIEGCLERGDDGKARQLQRKLLQTIMAGYSAHQVMSEYDQLARTLERLVSTQRRHDRELETNVPIIRVRALMRKAFDIMTKWVRKVSNPQEADEIIDGFTNEIGDLLTPPPD